MKKEAPFSTRNNITIYTFAALFFTCNLLTARTRTTDSLEAIYQRHAADDSGKVQLLTGIATSFKDYSLDSMLYYAHEALTLSYKINYDRGKAFSMRQHGLVYFHRNEYEKAINYNKESLRFYEKINDTGQVATMMRYIADIYYRQTNYPLAITWYNKALVLSAQVKNYSETGRVLVNMGGIYTDQSNYVSALDYYMKGLKAFESIQDNKGISEALINIGTVYSATGNYKLAKDYINRAIPINEKVKEKEIAFANIVNIGVVYTDLKDYKSALTAFEKGAVLADAIGDRSWQNTCAGNIAEIYYHTGAYDSAYMKYLPVLKEAIATHDTNVIILSLAGLGGTMVKTGRCAGALQYLLPGMSIARNKHMNQYIFEIAGSMSEAYKCLHDYKSALANNKVFQQYKDSLHNDKSDKHIEQLQFDYELQKKESQIALLNKDKIIAKSTSDRQKLIEWALSGGLLLVVIISILLFRNIRIEQLSKKKILKQKEEIQIQATRLEELVRFKDKTFSVLSHDLRAPMGTLTSSMMLLNEDVISQEEFGKLKPEITHQINSLNALLDNLLNWARTSIQGAISARPQPVALRSLIDQNVSLLKDTAGRKKIKITVNMPEDTTAYCDTGQVDIVLRNLISNAIKFTPAYGEITITSRIEANNIKLSVKDTGIGMQQEQIDKLFTAYAGNNTYGTDGERGIGLGLILCHEFTKGNNGNITVLSQPGMGSTFTIELPRTS